MIIISKIPLDKYYTPKDLAEYVVDKTKEIIGEDNIIEYIEPSAGGGVFLDFLDKPYKAYDIEPEDNRIIKQDYLNLDLPYKKGRCIIGNPPFGDRNNKNNLSIRFLNKSLQIGDYISFILPIRLYNNPIIFYKFDLIYSENLNIVNFSNMPILCCLNIYKRPKNNILNQIPKYNLKDIMIEEHHRTRKPLLEDDYDYRICSFGSSIGKECKPNTYCKELCFKINNKYKDKVINLLKNTDFKKEFPSVSTPYIAKWQIYKYLKEQIPELE